MKKMCLAGDSPIRSAHHSQRTQQGIDPKMVNAWQANATSATSNELSASSAQHTEAHRTQAKPGPRGRHEQHARDGKQVELRSSNTNIYQTQQLLRINAIKRAVLFFFVKKILLPQKSQIVVSEYIFFFFLEIQ